VTDQVNLDKDLQSAVDEAVAAGDYPDAEAVVREALKVWQQRRAEKAAMMEKARRLWDEGVASGPGEPMDWDELRTEARRRWQAKQA